MEFQLNKQKFESTLSLLQPFLDKKDFTEITSHIYISTVNNVLEIKAHDYESGLIVKIEDDSLQINSEGKATVNGTKIFNTIKALKNDVIKVKTDGNNLIVSQKRTTLKLPMFNPEQYKFPNLEDNEFQKIDIDIDEFISSIKKVLPTSDTNNIKQELNGVLYIFHTLHLRLSFSSLPKIAQTNSSFY